MNIAIVNIAEKRAAKQKGGCPDTLDTPWIRPCAVLYILTSLMDFYLGHAVSKNFLKIDLLSYFII